MRNRIIAERRFHLEGNSPKETALLLRIYEPEPSEGGEFECWWELSGGPGLRGSAVCGLDAVECLATSIAKVGTLIAELNASYFRGRLRWEGASKKDSPLGLPTPDGRWSYTERIPAYIKFTN